MSGDRYQQARKEGFEAGLSLAQAIQKAGGGIPNPEDIGAMTVTEFVCRIAAQNGIRFHYEDPQKPLLVPAPSVPCPECNDSGYAVHPENGWNKNARRCSRGCRVQCSICTDPNCDNPGGQH